jgi:arylsulfatase A-like enzyme
MAESEDPFFMWHNFWGPHGPYYVPEAYFEAYRNVDIPEWPNYRWEDADRNTPHQVKLHPKRNDLTWEDWADAVRHYYAFTTLIDEQIGRMIDHLRKKGLLENTIIIFAADHGETIGSHGGLTDKGWHHFEEIQRIPLIIRPPDSWPNPERDVVRSEWASLLDLYPTLLDLASAGESETPGLSLRPFIEGDSAPWRNEIFVEFSGVNSLATSMVTARKSHIKYGWNCSSHDELYDLDKDPWELCNLVEDSEYAGQLFNMRRLVADWMEETRYPGRGMYVHSRIH